MHQGIYKALIHFLEEYPLYNTIDRATYCENNSKYSKNSDNSRNLIQKPGGFNIYCETKTSRSHSCQNISNYTE